VTIKDFLSVERNDFNWTRRWSMWTACVAKPRSMSETVFGVVSSFNCLLCISLTSHTGSIRWEGETECKVLIVGNRSRKA
jgi:hypothetical protein